MNIGMWIIVIFGGAVGVLSSLYCVASLVAVIVWKLLRTIRYRISMFD